MGLLCATNTESLLHLATRSQVRRAKPLADDEKLDSAIHGSALFGDVWLEWFRFTEADCDQSRSVDSSLGQRYDNGLSPVLAEDLVPGGVSIGVGVSVDFNRGPRRLVQERRDRIDDRRPFWREICASGFECDLAHVSQLLVERSCRDWRHRCFRGALHCTTHDHDAVVHPLCSFYGPSHSTDRGGCERIPGLPFDDHRPVILGDRQIVEARPKFGVSYGECKLRLDLDLLAVRAIVGLVARADGHSDHEDCGKEQKQGNKEARVGPGGTRRTRVRGRRRAPRSTYRAGAATVEVIEIENIDVIRRQD